MGSEGLTTDLKSGSCRTVITVHHLKEAKAMAEAGGRSARDIFEWRDLRNPGLALRLEGKRAKWLLRYKRQTATLGLAEEFPPEPARQMANSVRKLLDAKIDHKPYLTARRVGTSDKEAFQAAIDAATPTEEKGWTWRELGQAFIEEWLSRPRAGRKSSPSTIA